MICGANQKDYHAIGVSIINFNKDRFKDLIAIKDGDKALDGGRLSLTKGIEVGHIFQLGDRYSAAMDATFLDENGKAKPFIMGCYGIGVSRLEAVIIESSYDDKGCVWKKECAPFSVHIIVSNFKDEAQAKFALELENSLENAQIEVLLDDRDERFGVKMADFELIGNPFGVVIGKGLLNGEVELIIRDGLIKEKIASSDILARLKELV